MTTKEISKKYKRGAWWALLAPVIILILATSLWGIVAIVNTTIEGSSDSGLSVFSTVLSVIMPLVIAASIILLLPGILFSIRRFKKSKRILVRDFDERSGRGDESTVPEEIKGWSWGAFGLNWIWGISHGLWISLLCFIPLVNIVFIFFLGAKGRAWAWKKEKWESVASFKKYEKPWNVLGVIFFIISMLGLILSIALSGLSSYDQNYTSSEVTEEVKNSGEYVLLGSENIVHNSVEYSIEYYDLGKQIESEEVEATSSAYLPTTQGNFIIAILTANNKDITETSVILQDFIVIDQEGREYGPLRQLLGVQGVYTDGQKIMFSWLDDLAYYAPLKPGIPRSRAILFEVAADSEYFSLGFFIK